MALLQFDTRINQTFNSGGVYFFGPPQTIARMVEYLNVFADFVSYESSDKTKIHVYRHAAVVPRMALVCVTFTYHLVDYHDDLEGFLALRPKDHLKAVNSINLLDQKEDKTEPLITMQDLTDVFTLWVEKTLSQKVSNDLAAFPEVNTHRLEEFTKQMLEDHQRLTYLNPLHTFLSREDIEDRLSRLEEILENLKSMLFIHQHISHQYEDLKAKLQTAGSVLLDRMEWIKEYGGLVEDIGDEFQIYQEKMIELTLEAQSLYSKAKAQEKEAHQLANESKLLAPPS